MIKIIYVADPEGGKLTMRAEGHAGYAPAGQDIVCAAVSCLMQTLAYSAAEDEHTSSCIYQGKEGPVLNVEAGDSVLMRDKFELVADGLDLLAEQYPENVNFKKRCKCSPAVDLQLFAETVPVQQKALAKLRRKKRLCLPPPRARAGRLLPLRWMRC